MLGDADGRMLSEAKFYNPWGVVLHKYSLYITDQFNHAIKVIKEGHDHVYTLAQRGLISNPRGITVDKYSTKDVAYIACSRVLLRIDLNSRAVIKLTGGTGPTGSLSASRPSLLYGITFLTESVLLYPSPRKDQLVVADLARDKVNYICNGVPLTQDGSIKTCSFDNPRSVMVMSWSVYIGQNRAIRRLPLKAITDLVRPAEPIG